MTMVRFLIKVTIPLVVLFGVSIGLIRARPYDDGGLRAFLTAPDNCVMPCWNGIQPEITLPEDAVDILKSIDSIGEIGFNLDADPAQIFWKWDQSRPAFMNDTQEVGYIWIEENSIKNIYLPGFNSFLDIWLALGRPERVVVFSNGSWGIPNVIYLSVYPNRFYVASAIFCKARTRDLWSAKTSIYIGQVPSYITLNAYNFDLDDLRGWLPTTLCR
jgi:hypothetical protein